MGYGLMVYSVDISKLISICGSRNDALRRSILGRFKRDIVSTNEQLGYSNERGEASVFMAIQHLIMDDAKTLDGALYAYGLEYIIRFFGKFLDNNLFYPCSIDFLTEEINNHLKSANATLDMGDLIFRNSPISFPSPDDFPFYGYWRPEVVKVNIEPLNAHSAKTPELEAIQEWLKDADSKGEGIFAYYY
jgi:hypothetical protein